MKLKNFLRGVAVMILVGSFGYAVHAQPQSYDEAVTGGQSTPNTPQTYDEAIQLQGADTVTDGPEPDTVTDGPDRPSGAFPTLQNPLRVTSVTGFLLAIVDILIYIGVIVAVFMFIFTGFKLVAARGDSDAIKEARKTFLAIVIGTAILISSKVIVEVIKSTFIAARVVDERLFDYRP